MVLPYLVLIHKFVPTFQTKCIYLSLVSNKQSSTATSLTLDELFTDELYDKTSLVFAAKVRSITTRVNTLYEYYMNINFWYIIQI